MATQDFAASIQGVALRVTRLDALGNPLNGPGDSFTTNAFMRWSFTPEYEEGDEIAEKAANGGICVAYKAADTLKRITVELAICNPDPELTSLTSGGKLLRKNLGTFADPEHRSVGWASPAVGDNPSGNGVSIEVWSRAIKDGKPASVLPYWHWVFPYVLLRSSGDRVIENGLLANTFEGYGLGNSAYGTGPDDRWEFASVMDSPYVYARSEWAPSGLNGLYIWHGELTAAISNVEVATGTHTLTTSTDHGFSVGDRVTVSGVTESPDAAGTHTITAVTDTTFSFLNGSATVASTVTTGSATVEAGAVPVNEFGDTDDDTNVPGATTYRSELPLDYTVSSSEDPSV